MRCGRRPDLTAIVQELYSSMVSGGEAGKPKRNNSALQNNQKIFIVHPGQGIEEQPIPLPFEANSHGSPNRQNCFMPWIILSPTRITICSKIKIGASGKAGANFIYFHYSRYPPARIGIALMRISPLLCLPAPPTYLKCGRLFLVEISGHPV